MKKANANKPSRDPQPIASTAWYYEDRGGITVVAESRTKDGAYISTVQTRLTWGKLMKSAARCGWKVSRAPRTEEGK